jgi:hypothetical protein
MTEAHLSALCPFCRQPVPATIIALRGSFKCPGCEESLCVPGRYELIVRAIAVGAGLIVSWRLGFDSVLLFVVGLMISPFFIAPIWRAIYAVKRPFLVPAVESFTRLDLFKR